MGDSTIFLLISIGIALLSAASSWISAWISYKSRGDESLKAQIRSVLQEHSQEFLEKLDRLYFRQSEVTLAITNAVGPLKEELAVLDTRTESMQSDFNHRLTRNTDHIAMLFEKNMERVREESDEKHGRKDRRSP